MRPETLMFLILTGLLVLGILGMWYFIFKPLFDRQDADWERIGDEWEAKGRKWDRAKRKLLD